MNFGLIIYIKDGRMFVDKSFDDIIRHWSLKFINQKLESYYKNLQNEEYLKRFSPLYLILGSLIIVQSLATYLGFDFLDSGKVEQGFGMLISVLIGVSGVLLEIVVNSFSKLQILRSVPLGILVFAGSAIGNCLVEKTPVVRPGFVLFLT